MSTFRACVERPPHVWAGPRAHEARVRIRVSELIQEPVIVFGVRADALLPALAAALVAVWGGYKRFRLIPDSWTYAYGWDAYAGKPTLVGLVVSHTGQMTTLILLSAAAAAGCVFLLPTLPARVAFLLVAGYWMRFPGVDMLGVLGVAMLARSSSSMPRRAGWWLLAGVLHPVAAVVSWPLLRPGRWTLPAVAMLSVVAVVAVGMLDAYTTTSRYLLPLAWLVFARLPDAARAWRAGLAAAPNMSKRL